MTVLRVGALLLCLSAVVLPPVAPAADARGAGPAEGAAAPAPAGSFVLPVAGAVVVTAFRAPAQRYGPGHRGVDLGVPPGAVVLSAGAGVVAFAGSVAGRPVVSVQHPSGLRTTYEPVVASVDAGALVQASSPLGTVVAGHPDCPVAACLHWGARLPDGDYLDPMSLLGPRRVRLLPWVDP